MGMQAVENGNGHTEIVAFLTEAHAKAMKQLNDDLMQAILFYEGDEELVMKALYKGASVNSADEEGYTAFMYAAALRYPVAIKIFLNKGLRLTEKQQEILDEDSLRFYSYW